MQVDSGSKTVLASGAISSCAHGVSSGRPRADYRTCAAALSAHLNGMIDTPTSIHVGDSDPLWWDGDMGCCYAAAQ